MATFFISDLHLSRHQPELGDLFLKFLHEYSADMESLYILGDLFDAWIGDDAPDPAYLEQIQALNSLSCPRYFLPGNRDFLVGKDFSGMTGCTILEDPIRMDFYGQDYLLSHGDIFCSDDVEYQNFRQLVRDNQWQQEFLSKSIEERIQMAQQLRAISQEQAQIKAQDIMDVNTATVDQYMRDFSVKLLIHGHTHRMHHHHLSDGRQRIVLGDWSPQQGNYIRLDDAGLEMKTYSASL